MFKFSNIKFPNIINSISRATGGDVGSSLAEGSKALVLSKSAGRLEKRVLSLADLHTAGYSSANIANLAKFGLTLGAPFLTFTIINFLTKNETDDTESADKKRNTAMLLGLGSFFAVFVGVQVFRRERMFLNFAGEGMAMQYVKFGLAPFVIGAVGIKLLSGDTQKAVIFSAFIAGTILLIARKFFFSYKINQLEKSVFSEIESLLKKCGNPKGCNHEHSGFLRFFKKNMNFTLNRMKIRNGMSKAFTPLEVLDFLIEKQKLDSAKGFIKIFT